MPPHENATLTRISKRGGAGGNVESFDGPPKPGAAAELWAGEERVYYRERRTRQRTAAGEDRFVEGELLVDGDVTDRVELKAGQIIEFVRDGDPAATTRTVRMVERRRLAEVPPDVQTDRLTFEPA